MPECSSLWGRLSPVEPKRIAAWDYQMGDVPEGAGAWWTENVPVLARGEYPYRIEFWKDETGRKAAVIYEYSKHPVTGERYIDYRSNGCAHAAVERPRVISLKKFPPDSLR